jgi:hypothetical protein
MEELIRKVLRESREVKTDNFSGLEKIIIKDTKKSKILFMVVDKFNEIMLLPKVFLLRIIIDKAILTYY